MEGACQSAARAVDVILDYAKDVEGRPPQRVNSSQ
jgi:hypothetical protein